VALEASEEIDVLRINGSSSTTRMRGFIPATVRAWGVGIKSRKWAAAVAMAGSQCVCKGSCEAASAVTKAAPPISVRIHSGSRRDSTAGRNRVEMTRIRWKPRGVLDRELKLPMRCRNPPSQSNGPCLR